MFEGYAVSSFGADRFVASGPFSLFVFGEHPARLLFTCPHDGPRADDWPLSYMFSQRRTGTTVRDVRVGPIMSAIASACCHIGLQVDTAQVCVPRVFLDPTRVRPGDASLNSGASSEVAYEDLRMGPILDGYIGGIEALLGRSVDARGNTAVCLVDMHGFNRKTHQLSYDIVLGTANRRTVPHGSIDRDFAGAMRARGYDLFLPEAHSIGSGLDPYNGGHFVRWVFQQWCVNVIQMEIASEWRFGTEFTQERQVRLVNDMAEAFVELLGRD